jgi:hypothetical protein
MPISRPMALTWQRVCTCFGFHSPAQWGRELFTVCTDQATVFREVKHRYLVTKCRRFGWTCYLLIYGSITPQMDRAGPSATSENSIILLAYYKIVAATMTSHLASVISYVFCFYGCSLGAVCAVHSVPPLSFDVDELRFWVGFLAASDIVLSLPRYQHVDSYCPSSSVISNGNQCL